MEEKLKEISLARNSFFFVCYKLLTSIFPLITVAYASHVILAVGIGKVSSAQNIVQYFVLIAALGIPNYGIREIAKSRENSSQINKIFSELFTINFISTVICTISYYLIILSSGFYYDEINLYLIVGITILLNIFNVDWFYQGLEEYSYITKRSFSIKLISLLLLFILVRTTKDYINYAIVYIIGVAGNNIVNCINLKKYNLHYSFRNCNLKMHLKPILILLCTTIAVELYTLVDTTMLTFMCSSENVAYYANSTKIVRLIITLVTAIGGVLLPRLSFYTSQKRFKETEIVVNKIFRILFFLLIPCGVGLFFVSDAVIILFFGESFREAIITLKIASLLIYALGFSNFFGTQILLTFGQEKKLLVATIFGASSNIVLNSMLIPFWQQNGAAVASVISELIVTLLTYYYAREYVKMNYNCIFIVKTLFSCFCMGVLLFILRIFIKSNILYLLIAFLSGILVYFGINFIVKNDVIEDLRKMIMSKAYYKKNNNKNLK